MSPNPLTACDRLALLLPWLNGDLGREFYYPKARKTPPEEVQSWIDYEQVRAAVADFTKSFDGSEAAAHLIAKPTDKVEALSEAALDRLEVALTCLLEQGFGEPTLQGGLCPLPLTGVELAACPAPRDKPRWLKTKEQANGQFLVAPGGAGAKDRVLVSPPGLGAKARVLVGPSNLGAQARRDWLASGAFLLQVRGPVVAVVPVLAAHLLLQAGMVALKRCARRDQPPWADCPKLFVIDPVRRGRPQQYCATSCGRRYKEQAAMLKEQAAMLKRRGRRKKS